MIKRCGLYIRVSTDLQAKEIEGSLKTQHQRLEEELARRSTSECQWLAVKVYEERGRSGKDTNRPEFQHMLQDIKDGFIDVVACTELSRVSRSVVDFLKFIHFLEEHHCDFLCLKQQFDTTTSHGKLLITITVALAQFERELTSERTKAAFLARSRRGIWNGGVVLGYDPDPTHKGRLVVNQEEADLVRLIFKLYTEVGSYIKVRDLINAKGYRTKAYTSRRGTFHPAQPFAKGDMESILHNARYTGKMEVNKMNKHKDQSALPEPERYQLVDGQHEALIDEALFNKVQSLITLNCQINKSFAHRAKYNHLLGFQIIHCGVCGSTMTPSWATGRSRIHPYYQCTKADKVGKHACQIRRVPAEELERVVFHRIKEVAQSPTLCEDLIQRTDRLLGREMGPVRKRKVDLERQLGEVDAQAKQVVKQLMDNGGSELFYIKETLREAEERRNQLKEELAKMEAEIQRYDQRTVSPETVRQGLGKFEEVFAELTPVEQKRATQLLVKEVTYTPERITLSLYDLPFVDPQDRACRFEPRTKWLPELCNNQNFPPQGGDGSSSAQGSLPVATRFGRLRAVAVVAPAPSRSPGGSPTA